MMMIFFVMGTIAGIARAAFQGLRLVPVSLVAAAVNVPSTIRTQWRWGITAIGAMVSLQIECLGGCTFQWPSPRRKLARLGPKDAIASGRAE